MSPDPVTAAERRRLTATIAGLAAWRRTLEEWAAREAALGRPEIAAPIRATAREIGARLGDLELARLRPAPPGAPLPSVAALPLHPALAELAHA